MTIAGNITYCFVANALERLSSWRSLTKSRENFGISGRMTLEPVAVAIPRRRSFLSITISEFFSMCLPKSLATMRRLGKQEGFCAGFGFWKRPFSVALSTTDTFQRLFLFANNSISCSRNCVPCFCFNKLLVVHLCVYLLCCRDAVAHHVR